MAITTSFPATVRGASPPAARGPSLLRRVYAAIVASQQRRAEREIARFLRGTKFTDSVEREIERRFLLPASEQWGKRS